MHFDANFSVMLNGKPTGRFGASKGLRQGCPLSPFLFTIVADMLGRLMDKAYDQGVIRGFTVGRETVHVSHLQFADDTLFLLEVTSENLRNAKCILKFFSACSGLNINMEKSSLLGISLDDNMVDNFASELGCGIGSWPIKYLGLPLGGNPMSIEFWRPVIEKVAKRLDGWKKGFLSRGGRVTLIQSVLANMLIYYMSIFKLPGRVAELIEKMMRTFLWDSGETGKGRSLVVWNLVVRSKENGGLGLGNLKKKNLALLGKSLWRFPREQ